MLPLPLQTTDALAALTCLEGLDGPGALTQLLAARRAAIQQLLGLPVAGVGSVNTRHADDAHGRRSAHGGDTRQGAVGLHGAESSGPLPCRVGAQELTPAQVAKLLAHVAAAVQTTIGQVRAASYSEAMWRGLGVGAVHRGGAIHTEAGRDRRGEVADRRCKPF